MAIYNDILNTEEEVPGNDDLLRYIANDLTPAEQHALEKKSIDSNFVNDAMEGLAEFSDTKNVNTYISQLNKNLHQQLAGKKNRKPKKQVSQQLWSIVAALALLAICVFGYLFIHLFRQP